MISLFRLAALRRVVHGLVLAGAIAMLAAGCDKSPRDLLADARERHSRGDNLAAAVQLKNVLAKEPGNVEAHLLAGRVQIALGNALEAEATLRAALRLGAPDAEVVPLLAKVMIDLQRYARLLDEIGPSPAWPPGAQAEVMLLRGEAHLGLGALEKAKEQIDAAEAELPERARVDRARLIAARNDFDGALRAIDAVLAEYPASAGARVFRGDLLHAAGRNDEALADYAAVPEKSPLRVAALLGQVPILIGRREHAAAKAVLEKARAIAPESPMLNFNLAFLALQEERFSACQESLLRVFRAIPDHGPTTLLSGALLHATGNHLQAQQVLTGFLSIVPGSVMGRKLLAASMMKTGQPQSALYILEPLLRENPDSVVLALAGQAYMERGQPEEAQPLLEQAVGMSPGSAPLLTSLGVARLAVGNDQRGLADLDAAVKLDPDSAKTNQVLITALIGQNRLDQALEAATRLEAAAPREATAHQLKGAVLLARREMQKAEAAFGRALELKPGYFPAAAALAQMRLRNKDVKGAERIIDDVLSADPKNLDALLLAANLQLAQGNRAGAIEGLRKAIEVQPRSAQAYVMMAELYWSDGEIDEALSIAQRAQQSAPRDPKVAETVGRLLSAKGDRRGAVEAYARVVGMLPDSVGAMLQLAAAQSAAGEHALAVNQATEALQAAPDNVEAMTARGLVLLQAGQFAQAQAQAQDIQRVQPAEPQGYALEGDALMALGNGAGALKAYEKADSIRPTGALRVRIHQAHVLLAPGSDAGEPRLREWIKAHPTERAPRHYLGQHYLATKRPAQALAEYELLLKTNPQDVLALNNAALALDQLGDGRALDHARKAYALRPDDAPIMDTLGTLLVASGDLIRGVELLRKAAVLAPGVPSIRLHLAQAHARSGDADRARSELQDLIARHGKSAEAAQARDLLGRLRQQ